MDSYVRQLAIGTAKASTRRGFLGDMVRGVVGVGLGVGFLMGGGKFAWANAQCASYDTVNAKGGCDASIACRGGDSQGCHGFTGNSHTANYCPASACNSASNGCQGVNPVEWGSWVCCCNHQQSVCVDCGIGTGDSANCICQFYPTDNTGARLSC